MSAQVSRNVAADQMTACRLDASVMRAAIKTRTVSPAIARSSLGRLADWSDSRTTVRRPSATPAGTPKKKRAAMPPRTAARMPGDDARSARMSHRPCWVVHREPAGSPRAGSKLGAGGVAPRARMPARPGSPSRTRRSPATTPARGAGGRRRQRSPARARPGSPGTSRRPRCRRRSSMPPGPPRRSPPSPSARLSRSGIFA